MGTWQDFSSKCPSASYVAAGAKARVIIIKAHRDMQLCLCVMRYIRTFNYYYYYCDFVFFFKFWIRMKETRNGTKFECSHFFLSFARKMYLFHSFILKT